MEITKHAKVRSQQRGIPASVIDLIMQYGKPKKAPGKALQYEVHGETIPQLQSRLKGLLQQVEKLKNTVVVVAEDGSIITVYHK